MQLELTDAFPSQPPVNNQHGFERFLSNLKTVPKGLYEDLYVHRINHGIKRYDFRLKDLRKSTVLQNHNFLISPFSSFGQIVLGLS